MQNLQRNTFSAVTLQAIPFLNFQQINRLSLQFVALLSYLLLSQSLLAQETDSLQQIALFSAAPTADSTQKVRYFSSAVTVTNNGISLLPALSLGKPAAIFDLGLSNGKLSFEPQLRFSYEGKPWTFLFWWRYKLLNTSHFRLNVGMHPAMAFKSETVTAKGVTTEVMTIRRYLAGEFAPTWLVSKHVGLGIYYLYSHGLDEGTIANTNFVALSANFSDIHLYKRLGMQASLQPYYLKIDDRDGFYVNANLTVFRKDFPFSISTILSQPIQTNITVKQNLIWNVSLMYSFRKAYKQQ